MMIQQGEMIKGGKPIGILRYEYFLIFNLTLTASQNFNADQNTF